MQNAAAAASDRKDALERVASLFMHRYRDDRRPAGNLANETIETLLSHRSARSYLPTPLPEGALELAIAAAQSASTSSHLQAWSVVAVEDKALKSRLNVLARNQRQIDQAPLLLIWLADLSRLRDIATGRSLPAEGLDYVEGFLLGVIDATIAAQNAAVAFESMGYGISYIGGMRNHPEKVAAELGLPPEVFAVFGMTVGTPDPAVETDMKPRLPQATVLHREQYRRVEGERVRRFDGIMRIFQEEQAMKVVDWSEKASERIGSVKALDNREHIRAALATMGFKMK